MNINDLLIKIATIYPLGKSNVAPGTISSIFTCIVFYIISEYTNIIELVIIFIFSLYISFISVQRYIEKYGYKDHKCIVIDEFAGQFLSLMVIPFSKMEMNFINIFIIFIIFRFFDISKIGLRSVEKLPGVLGIILDDLVAGIFVIIIVIGFLEFFNVG